MGLEISYRKLQIAQTRGERQRRQLNSAIFAIRRLRRRERTTRTECVDGRRVLLQGNERKVLGLRRSKLIAMCPLDPHNK